jgi:uncharacterized protein (DUF983 family)
MTLETKVQTFYPAYRIIAKPLVRQVKERQTWISCPRCIGGSMYPESNREHVCMQCGYHLYHGTVNRKPGSEIPTDSK